ncbi:MAG: hypothetical protein R2712_10210 [Vicinamibacterales bacterium]
MSDHQNTADRPWRARRRHGTPSGGCSSTSSCPEGLRPVAGCSTWCGCLRGGVHFVSYLADGHYFGMDRSEALLDAGREHELAAERPIAA